MSKGDEGDGAAEAPPDVRASPPDVPYLQQVEELFLGLVRRGLALRAADVEVVRDWERRGVPVEVVRRGLVDGIRRFLEGAPAADPIPTTLRYYRRTVDEAFETFRRGTASGVVPAWVVRPAAPTSDLRARAIERVQARIAGASGRARERLAAAVEALRDGPILPVLEAVDTDLVDVSLADLPPGAAEAATAAVREAVEAARARGIGREALKDLEATERRKTAERNGFRSVVDEILAAAGGSEP